MAKELHPALSDPVRQKSREGHVITGSYSRFLSENWARPWALRQEQAHGSDNQLCAEDGSCHCRRAIDYPK